MKNIAYDLDFINDVLDIIQSEQIHNYTRLINTLRTKYKNSPILEQVALEYYEPIRAYLADFF